MGKKDSSNQKHEAPVPDGKLAPPSTSDWTGHTSISQLVEATNLSSTGISETLSAKSGQDALVQVVTHPVMLALVVGVSLLLLNRR